MEKYIILPYAQRSKSAKALAKALSCNRIHLTRNTYLGYNNHIVINWGSQKVQVGRPGSLNRVSQILNHPSNIINASNKLRTLQLLEQANVPTLEYTTSSDVAAEWHAETPVFARTLLSANSGRGIAVATDTQELVDNAPLYTKFFPKVAEYRVHVFRDQTVCVQQKRLKASENRTGAPHEYIWNHDIGQRTFARFNVDYPTPNAQRVLSQTAINAVKALSLDFGAVDLGYIDDDNLAVFEVNTAFGLEGTTLTDWTNTFSNYLSERVRNEN